MPFGSRFGRLGQWWAERSLLERVLIVVVSIAIILIIILWARLHHGSQSGEKVCTTPACIKAAAIMLEHVDPNVNPCENFYQFSCGNFRKNGDENKIVDFEVFGEQLLLEIYKEPIRDGEHKMVRAAKKLFRACMDVEQIERDQVKIMKEVLKKAGGWPVLEGEDWDETSFDWIKATYKLRELGYYHSIFLDLLVLPDPENNNRTLLMVSSRVTYNVPYGIFELDKVALMQEVARTFGVKDVDKISVELADAHTFLQEMQKYDHPFYIRSNDKKAYKKYAVEEYQQSCKNMDWLQFINTIVAPTIQLSKDDPVLFPAPQNLTNWLELISKTPKRTQANYMMWRVIEETIPYFIKKVSQDRGGFSKYNTREQNCVTEIEIRFTPTPIVIMTNRRDVPVERKKQLEELLLNIKLEVLDILKKIEWMDENDKQKIVAKAKLIKMMIAQPQNYFDDKVLDDLDVDMIESKNEDFLSLIAQANRNRKSIEYSEIKNPLPEGFKHTLFYTYMGLPSYIETLNTLFVPAALTKSSIFDEKRPHYLNYGSIGCIVGYHFIDAIYKLATKSDSGWSNKTNQEFLNKIRCIEKQLGDYKVEPQKLKSQHLSYNTISDLVSYSAYKRWTQKNGEELKLISVPYTPKQMFWISAMSSLCESKIPAQFLSASVRTNKNFANDFGCAANSKTNFVDVCHLF